ncbi:hypothetical protein cyc_01655 [Cyclospora cayetanensis]|uniref:Uncharacterized protein n=1 Tax=Cyclospora cayetanensis TaxID=88456 RepID=A0A1D3D5K4_9EIME|nr:hypothetical protein cyc_01655 [Cyclospora cayetanensis]
MTGDLSKPHEFLPPFELSHQEFFEIARLMEASRRRKVLKNPQPFDIVCAEWGRWFKVNYWVHCTANTYVALRQLPSYAYTSLRFSVSHSVTRVLQVYTVGDTPLTLGKSAHYDDS